MSDLPLPLLAWPHHPAPDHTRLCHPPHTPEGAGDLSEVTDETMKKLDTTYLRDLKLQVRRS
jgi:hypothetical protein